MTVSRNPYVILTRLTLHTDLSVSQTIYCQNWWHQPTVGPTHFNVRRDASPSHQVHAARLLAVWYSGQWTNCQHYDNKRLNKLLCQLPTPFYLFLGQLTPCQNFKLPVSGQALHYKNCIKSVLKGYVCGHEACSRGDVQDGSS